MARNSNPSNINIFDIKRFEKIIQEKRSKIMPKIFTKIAEVHDVLNLIDVKTKCNVYYYYTMYIIIIAVNG